MKIAFLRPVDLRPHVFVRAARLLCYLVFSFGLASAYAKPPEKACAAKMIELDLPRISIHELEYLDEGDDQRVYRSSKNELIKIPKNQDPSAVEEEITLAKHLSDIGQVQFFEEILVTFPDGKELRGYEVERVDGEKIDKVIARLPLSERAAARAELRKTVFDLERASGVLEIRKNLLLDRSGHLRIIDGIYVDDIMKRKRN